MTHPKDCPFCKGKPNLSSHSYSVGPVLWQVRCPCGLTGPVQYDEEQAASSWNRLYVKTDDLMIDELVARSEIDYRTNKGA